ncbi:MAG: family hydrolase [Ilumatobacteraceae bacterium]|nr:family hydrolase [Ilumatobacteraceae bacterium]
MSARPSILFDVDGTLVDSNYLHTVAWSRALRAHDTWAPMNAIHRLIGMGSDTLLTTLIGREDDAIAQSWKSEYELLMAEVRSFPFAAQLLSDMSQAGVAVVLATSAPADHLARMIDLLDVGGLIDVSTTSDDVEHAKPEPEIFLTAMHRANGSPDRTLVVGDSTWDVQSALAARLPCIAVETGGFSEAELLEAGAVAVYADVEALWRNASRSPLADLLS